MGLIPLSHEAISQAIVLNGAAVERNAQAFEMGRWAALNPEAAARWYRRRSWKSPGRSRKRIAFRADHLTAYQGRGWRGATARWSMSIADPRLQGGRRQGLSQALGLQG
jgi:indolepyruvate ferredoxin oxidoreductase